MTIEARLVGDWAETYPGNAQIAFILPLAFEGPGIIKDLRLRVEGVHKPLAWVGCFDGLGLFRPAPVTAPVTAQCIFRGAGQHAPDYQVRVEGKTGWTWQVWGEFELRPGVARYVMRPSKVK